MLKKFFIVVILSVFALVGNRFSLCSAAMPYSEMYLGGFTVGSSYSEMTKMYGAPTSQDLGIEHNACCIYGNSVVINYNNFDNKIQGINVKANNGWSTPAGLTVGMNISDALDMYGEPAFKKSSSIKTVYCYFHKPNMGRSTPPDFGFFIVFNKDSGKILQLSVIGDNTMISFKETECFDSIVRNMLE
ncbi:MAG: hypothetical protein IKT98_08075 [Selenomonadaceae bacterium]|nr:hypothetical protein [Selenomonadaceae bacterium]